MHKTGDTTADVSAGSARLTPDDPVATEDVSAATPAQVGSRSQLRFDLAAIMLRAAEVATLLLIS